LVNIDAGCGGMAVVGWLWKLRIRALPPEGSLALGINLPPSSGSAPRHFGRITSRPTGPIPFAAKASPAITPPRILARTDTPGDSLGLNWGGRAAHMIGLFLGSLPPNTRS
jgi:hypothetical protein